MHDTNVQSHGIARGIPGVRQHLIWLAAAIIAVSIPAKSLGDSPDRVSTSGVSKSGPAPAPVTTWHNDLLRTGQYPYETTLTQSNVTSTSFGRLFTQYTDAPIECQPLYMPGITIAGKGVHDSVFVATTTNKVYAYDAHNASGANASPLWTANLGAPVPGSAYVEGNEPNVGVLSTPVIDPTTNTLYVSSMLYANGTGSAMIHALDLGSGAEKFGGPTKITGSVGSGSNTINFDPMNGYQRPGLLLLNGVVYICFGGLYGDPAPDRGWIFGYSAANLQKQVYVFNTAPDRVSGYAGGAIWASGGAPSSDGKYIFVSTGNGDFDANQSGGHDYGDSILMLLPLTHVLWVEDYFTPYNQQHLADSDLDLGCSNPMLLPPQPGTSSLVLLQLTKTNTQYLVSRQMPMGGYKPSGDQIFQERSDALSGECESAPVYFNNAVYYARDSGPLEAIQLNSGKLASSPFATTSTTFFHATSSISYNGNLSSPGQSAILWIVEQNGKNAVLHAYSPYDLHELYNSNNGRDGAGWYIKWGVPTVAGGKVYVPCGNELAVYGNGGFGAPTR